MQVDKQRKDKIHENVYATCPMYWFGGKQKFFSIRFFFTAKFRLIRNCTQKTASQNSYLDPQNCTVSTCPCPKPAPLSPTHSDRNLVNITIYTLLSQLIQNKLPRTKKKGPKKITCLLHELLV